MKLCRVSIQLHGDGGCGRLIRQTRKKYARLGRNLARTRWAMQTLSNQGVLLQVKQANFSKPRMFEDRTYYVFVGRKPKAIMPKVVKLHRMWWLRQTSFLASSYRAVVPSPSGGHFSPATRRKRCGSETRGNLILPERVISSLYWKMKLARSCPQLVRTTHRLSSGVTGLSGTFWPLGGDL